MEPSFLVEQTNELTQSAGSSTLVMISCFTRDSSPLGSGSHRGSGTVRSGWTMEGIVGLARSVPCSDCS